MSDNMAAERIALDTQRCFAKGQLTSQDPHDTSVANFWLRQMTQYTLTLKANFTGDPAEFCNSLEDWVSQYFRFVCTKLLDIDSLHDAKQLADSVQPILQLPELLSPLGQFVLEILTEDIPKGTDLTEKVAKLLLDARHNVFNSKLWGALQYEEQLSKVSHLKQLTKQNKVAEFFEAVDTCCTDIVHQELRKDVMAAIFSF